jgi:hypothetical protein
MWPITEGARLRERAHRWLRRPSRSASLSQRAILAPRAVCACAVVIALLVVLVLGHRGGVAPSARAERLRIQTHVTAMFYGIPQHGVSLGQPTAPVTLQVFVDLEDHNDGTRWLDSMLPPILAKFVRTNIVRLEFHSLKTDTLNRRQFFAQQIAALAAGAQNLLWNYIATFMNEQGREFTNYVTAELLTGIAEQIPGLNVAEWEQAGTSIMAKSVAVDNNTAVRVGFHDSPSFRIGLTGGAMRNFSGRTVYLYHKYIIHKTPSGERYVAGVSSEWQHPVSLIDAIDLKNAVDKLI